MQRNIQTLQTTALTFSIQVALHQTSHHYAFRSFSTFGIAVVVVVFIAVVIVIVVVVVDVVIVFGVVVAVSVFVVDVKDAIIYVVHVGLVGVFVVVSSTEKRCVVVVVVVAGCSIILRVPYSSSQLLLHPTIRHSNTNVIIVTCKTILGVVVLRRCVAFHVVENFQAIVSHLTTIIAVVVVVV